MDEGTDGWNDGLIHACMYARMDEKSSWMAKTKQIYFLCPYFTLSD